MGEGLGGGAQAGWVQGTVAVEADGRGVLYPGRLPAFHREPAPAELNAVVQWFWVPSWNLPPGVSSRQEILPFPAANLVVEPEGVRLYGPTTGVSVRVLEGRGWAVGALLLPAGLGRLHARPGALRDTSMEVDAPGLHRAVVTAMGGSHAAGQAYSGDREVKRSAAVRAVADWLVEEALPIETEGLVANAMVELIASTREVVRFEQVAEHLGYADQAHLAADLRAVLGCSPSRYRWGQVSGS